MNPTGDIGNLINGLPGTEPKVLSRAREAMINGRNDLALQILESAVNKHATSNLRIALGHVLARDRRYKDAMGHMVAILREEPRNAEALLLLTDALLECGEYERANKMLDRARACSADARECERLSEKWANLTGETATNVVSEQLSAHDQTTRPKQSTLLQGELEKPEAEPARLQIQPGRARMNTMPGGPAPQWDVGDPNSDAPDAAPSVAAPPAIPETLQSGTFSTLSGWSDDTIESGLYPGPDMGAPPEQEDSLQSAISEAFDDFEVQDTMAFVPSEIDDQAHEYANPSDQTAALVFDDDEVHQTSPAASNQPAGPVPSLEYDDGFQDEVEQQFEVDEEPTKERDSFRSEWGDPVSPTLEEVPSKKGFALPAPEPEAVPQPQHFSPQAPSPAASPGFQAPAPSYDAPDPSQIPQSPFGPANFSDPMQAPPRRPEPTGLTPAGAVSQESRATSEPKKKRSLLPVLILVLLLVVVVGAAGTAILSSYTQAEELQTQLKAARDAASADSFTGLVAAEQEYVAAIDSNSFLGPALDDMLAGLIPPVGDVTAAQLKREALTERAFVVALVEYRFESAGSRNAKKAYEAAKEASPESPFTIAAGAYIALAEGAPHKALEQLGAAKGDSADLLTQQARVDAHLDFEQPAAAALALKDFRALEQPTLYQMLLIARVDLALDDPAAATLLKELRAQHPDHIGVRIAQAHVLLEGDESREEAGRSLQTIETKLASEASQYQLAQVSAARGALEAAKGNEAAAEKAYRTGIRKMPSRADLYMPLVHQKFRNAEYQEVDELLEKAKTEGASHPLLVLSRARLMLLKSAPETVAELLEGAEFEDGRKDLFLGLAQLEQGKPGEAKKTFEAATKRDQETPGASAFLYVARVADAPGEAEEAMYQVDRLASKHPKDSFVHWASALVRLAHADQLKDRKAFEKALDEAEQALEKAIEIDPGWPLFHYTACDVHLRGLEGKDAKRACEAGQKLAPDYFPGLVTLAEVHLQQGEFEQAAELLKKLSERRPDSDRVALLDARTAIEMGNHEKAQDTINAMLGKPVSNGFEMKLLEGRLAFAQRNYAKASGYLAAAHDLRPQDGEAGVFYAITLTRLNRHKEAEEVLDGYLKDRVWASLAWTTFAEIRRRQKRYSDAFENLGIALRKLKDAPLPKARTSDLFLQSALTYRDKHNWRHPSVLSRLNLALSKGDPNDADVHFHKGLYYLKQRRPNESDAAESFQKVVDVAPWRCDAFEAVEKLYKKLDREKSLEALKESPAAELCKKEK